MKKNFILIIALISASLVAAQGIAFESETTKWADILAKAKAAKKLVFVDAYTTWCGPCKWMVANTFPNKGVGEVFNANFVNAKIDMEKGEGIGIAQKYGIRAYPTYIFVNGDGELVHRSLGAMPAEKFVKVGNAAVDPEQQLVSLKKKFDGGERSADFLKKTAKVFSDAMENGWAEEVMVAYLKTEKDWLTADNMKLVKEYAKSVNGDLFQHIVKNYAAYEKAFETGEIESMVYNRAYNLLVQKFYQKQSNKFDRAAAQKLADEKFPSSLATKAVDFAALTELKFGGDNDKFLSGIATFMDKYPSNDVQFLNQYAWQFYEQTDNKALLEKALSWSLKSIGLMEEYALMDTAAALYFKLGKKSEAKAMAEKAIKKAKSTGEDAAETEALLKKIEAM